MGWFSEQIKQRKMNDDRVFSDSFVSIAEAVVGKKVSAALYDDSGRNKNEIDRILKYYHVKAKDILEHIKDIDEQIEYLMRPCGMMRRDVTLEKGWYRDAIGALLGTRHDNGKVVALIPTGLSGYRFFDEETGKWVKLNGKTEKLIEEKAVCFYHPLPLKKISIVTLMKYIAETLSMSDFVLLGLTTLVVTLIGLLFPKLNNIIFSDVIESQSIRLLLAVSVFMICVTVSSMLFESVKALFMSRIGTKMDISVQAAFMARVLSLPAEFFKQYSSGELSSRVQYINMLCDMLVSTVLSTGLVSAFSLVYISQIFVYAPALVIPAMCIIIVTVAFSVISAFTNMKISRRQMELGAKESGMSYALISGVQKIKLAGAEKRAFARWAKLFSQEAEIMYNPPVFFKINSVISTAISLVGSIVMYYAAAASHVSVADYYAFNTAYGMVFGAFMSLSGIALTFSKIKPTLEMAKPILETIPEVSDDKQVVTSLSGGIELSNISFRYNEDMPPVIDNLSIKIRPGQYVAIVGRTGCGKSTLMRIMLGFEKPQKGAVYYDGKDIEKLDLKSLRKNIGVVMQNGKLFQGDIFSNIVISAPQLTLDEAWEAAELAGIAKDIRRMPMGMNTFISEGSGGISGGQKQRLMIARAIAPKPKILMFDEATSALDNLTQKKISSSLETLKCTRIVIAHRLSTIKQCDRIIVIDQGRIVEDGTYNELITNDGSFAQLVARQRLDDTEYVGKTTLF